MPEPSYAPDAVDDLIVRFFCRETVPDEHRFLREWIDRSPANRARFIGFRNVYLSSLTLCRDAERSALTGRGLFLRRRAAAQAAQSEQTVQVAQTVEPLRPKRPTRSRPSPRSPHPLLVSLSPFSSRLRRTASAAAVVLFAAGLWCGLPQLRRPDRPTVGMPAERVEFSVSFGSRASTTLPDGSRIRLNAGSTLTYTTDYGREERTVALQGEAFFKVRADAERPFVVRAGELAIVATGTAFNVKAYPEEQFVTTTLESGSVRVQGLSRRNRSFDIELTPRQSCLYYRGGDSVLRSGTLHPEEAALAEQVRAKEIPALRISNVKTLLHTSWKDPRWIVEYETLASLAEKLERRYNVTIRFRQSEAGAYRFTGAFENETIEEIMRLLRHATPIRYTIERGRITVSVDPSRRRTFENAAG